MSDMRRCDRGEHIYDASVHSHCPSCSSRVFDFDDDDKAKHDDDAALSQQVAAQSEELAYFHEMEDVATLEINQGRQTIANANEEPQAKPVIGEFNMDDETTVPLKGKQNPAQQAVQEPAQPQARPEQVVSPAQGPQQSDITRVVKSRSGIIPVAGWLVVIAGPGKGASRQIFAGVNSIGRSKYIGAGIQQKKQEINLDFGRHSDIEIARVAQAKLIYDKKGNIFYIQHGGGSNLTYLNDMPVLEPKVLTAYDRIAMGQTTLSFVPFCGEQFSWDKNSDNV